MGAGRTASFYIFRGPRSDICAYVVEYWRCLPLPKVLPSLIVPLRDVFA